MSSIPTAQNDIGPTNTPSENTIANAAKTILSPIASLKLTVALFAMAIFLILIGTLALADHDIWEIMQEYFTAWFIWIPVRDFFPSTWAPDITNEQAGILLAGAFVGLGLVSSSLVAFNVEDSKKQIASVVFLSGFGFFWGAMAVLRHQVPFVGGATIGATMLANLCSAHLIRFRIQASGSRLIAGICLTTLGVIVTAAIIVLGHDMEGGIQGTPPFEWTTLWSLCKAGLSVFSALLFLNWFQARTDSPAGRIIRRAAGIAGLASGAISIWLWVTGNETYLGDAGMRILWQLIQSTAAGLVLLSGLLLLFRKRAGVVELHLGIMLLMFGQWFVTNYDLEQQINLAEGETKNFAHDIRSVELAVISESPDDPAQEHVVTIPLSYNGKETSFVADKVIQDEQIPFEITVLKYFRNTDVKPLSGAPEYNDIEGDGKIWKAVEVPGSSGAASSSVNLASMYFRIAKDGKNYGSFLVSQVDQIFRDGKIQKMDSERVEIDGRNYDLQIRFVREYKPYVVQLNDVRKEDYLGTSTPRHYASHVKITESENGIEHDLNIWMNNPVRFAGETFYQSGYQELLGTEYTTLQLVRNQGWMIPYVSCMICSVGMLYHFGLVLHRFLSRTRTGEKLASIKSPEEGVASLLLHLWAQRKINKKDRSKKNDDSTEQGVQPRRRILIPAFILALATLLVLQIARPKENLKAGMDLAEFGRLPIVYQGRVKPLDTLARNSLKLISERESFKCRYSTAELKENWSKVSKKLARSFPEMKGIELAKISKEDSDVTVSQLIDYVVDKSDAPREQVVTKVEAAASKTRPAIRWLADAICSPADYETHKVIRITDLKLLESLELKRRKGYRYSIEELIPKINSVLDELGEAQRQKRENPRDVTREQTKLLDLNRKLGYLMMLKRAFDPEPLPQMTSPEQFKQELSRRIQEFEGAELPLIVAPYEPGKRKVDTKEKWKSYAHAWPIQNLLVQFGQPINPGFEYVNSMFVAYARGEAEEFNQAVDDYKQLLKQAPPEELIAKKSFANSIVVANFKSFYRFEEFFNRCAAFLTCAWLYIFSFVLLLVGWLTRSRSSERSANTLLWFTWIIHTGALAARIYISGRPPVTNLYSSAVFIGWGCVTLALVAEMITRRGMFSAVASVIGYMSLWIAYLLALDGDTFEVLQAVLDTQFWLATHVVSITLGYSTTFLAGGLGIMYLIRGMFTPGLDKASGKELARMIYGTLCFAILFSFVGTVLGGLWADDSWGRFWGWDPKENGALIIVLWNALILHARWDGMVKERGMAVLAIGGNIVTAWSWFGVNELGVGLHSYGFTEGRLFVLALFIASQFALVLTGCLPKHCWWSHNRQLSEQSDQSLSAES